MIETPGDGGRLMAPRMSGVGYKCASGATENLVRCTPNSGPSRVRCPVSPTTDLIQAAQDGQLFGFALNEWTPRISAMSARRCPMTKSKRYKRYSAEFKRESILRASEEGNTDTVVCEELGISTRQFRRWRDELRLLGDEAFGEPVVDRGEEVVGFVRFVLMFPQASKAHRRTKLPGFRLKLLSNRDPIEEAGDADEYRSSWRYPMPRYGHLAILTPNLVGAGSRDCVFRCEAVHSRVALRGSR